MRLYLMRHAEADSGPQLDPTRGLTPRGKKQAKLMGKWLARQTDQPELIIESNMLRSQQTAAKISKRLKAEVKRLPAFDPDGSPEKALAAVISSANGYNSVIAVSHGPLVEEILAYITDGDPAYFDFAHAAVAALDWDGKTGSIHWLVTPNTVARDEDEQALLEAARRLSGVLLREAAPAAWQRHDRAKARHEKRLARVVLAGLRAQRRSVETSLRRVFGRVQEADAPSQDDIQALLDTLQPLSTYIPPGAWKKILEAAAIEGANGLDIGIEGLFFDTASPSVLQYLADHALEKIGKDVDATTVERLQAILTGGLKDGSTFQEIIKAIRDAGAFSRDRAQTIAVTEVGNAYTAGTVGVARDLASNGLDLEKQWLPDDDPCEICEANAEQDWIPLDEEFDSGDDAPLAHPNCRCVLLTRVVHSS